MGNSVIEFGVLLPHFSDNCTWDRLVGFAPQLEELGFDSVWARDNMSFRGHGFEAPGNTFVDPFVTLSAVAARTRRLKVGTAVVTPFRHPLVTAQLFGSLSWVAGGRLEIGLGPGTPRKPFDLTGIPFEDRITLCRETAEILRVVAEGEHVSYTGEFTRFEDVTIDPAPPIDAPIWYGGASNASIRRAVQYCNGIVPGRCPFRRYDVALDRLRSAGMDQGKTMKTGSIPLVSIGKSREDALGKIDVQSLLDTATERWKSAYERVEDLAGALIAGTAQECVEQVQEYVDRRVDLLIFDARLLMGEFEEVIQQIGEEIVPAFRSPRVAAL
jgi:alkanesulfonate monooxygenase SsuD/methylene tetrahydromethanopterin reductase-like flavin-dependent oxidoreductase (luciferase family)